MGPVVPRGGRAAAAWTGPWDQDRTRQAAALLFVGGISAAIMTIELVAARMAAPYIGDSLYTWTGIIGAVLAGMSIGHAFGGVLADRFALRPTMATLLLLSGALVVSLPRGAAVVLTALPRPWDPVLAIFLGSLLLFGAPCLLLAATVPLAYKASVRGMSDLGRRVGGLGAAGVVGALVGTYSTGFFLVQYLGSGTVMFLIGSSLVLLGALITPWTKTKAGIAPRKAAMVAGLLIALVILQATTPQPCDQESAYYCIRVDQSVDDEGRAAKTLVLDRLIHSGVYLDAPHELWYEYERMLANALEIQDRDIEAALFLGGGGLVMPRHVERAYPNATVEVVEIDPAVTSTALGPFLAMPLRGTVHHQDARVFMAELSDDHRYDLVFADVFHGVTVPWHLTTLEHASAVNDHLAPGGIYAMNVVDVEGGRFLAAMARTLEAAFDHVVVLQASERTVPGTFLLLASGEALEDPASRAVPVVGGMVLRDAYAPVERLMLPALQAYWKGNPA